MLQRFCTAAKHFIDFLENTVMACLGCLRMRTASCRLLLQSHLLLTFLLCCLVVALMYCLVFLPCLATWSHGPNGKNERSTIRSRQSIQSAVAAGTSYRTTTGAWLPWPGLWPTRSPAISGGDARAYPWKHGGHAVWSTGILHDTSYLVMSSKSKVISVFFGCI